MDISYLGHSSFRIKSKVGTVVTDPFSKEVGFSFPSGVTADIVTVSHDHFDHSNAAAVGPTSNREKPFIITAAGEYEVADISVFGHSSFHDDSSGKERGDNIVYSIIMDGMTVVHLGDLGHTLSDTFIEKLGSVDVLLCPVGGVYTINASQAVDVIAALEPSYIIPMHYKTDKHDPKGFEKLGTVEEFEKALGLTSEPVKSFAVPATKPEQTTLILLD